MNTVKEGTTLFILMRRVFYQNYLCPRYDLIILHNTRVCLFLEGGVGSSWKWLFFFFLAVMMRVVWKDAVSELSPGSRQQRET